MLTSGVFKGVFAVPSLPRRHAQRTLAVDAAERIVRHVEAGDLTRRVCGGNAFLYHVMLDDYDALLGWLAGFPAPRWAIPSVGPSFGLAPVARVLHGRAI